MSFARSSSGARPVPARRPDHIAGQDALSDDEHGRMNLEPEDYTALTGMLIDGTDLPLP
jgi:hypothetical protein